MMDSAATWSRHEQIPLPSSQDVAIIGMACVFPQAPNLQAFWNNILGKVNAITDPPPEWGAELVYDPASSDNDRLYTKRGGYLGNLTEFDPYAYGVMPRAVDGGEPEHFIALRVAHEALADAGYLDRHEHRQRTGVILGRGTYVNRGYITVLQHTIAVDQTLRVLRALHPEYTDAELQTIKTELKASLPPFNQETSPSLVPSVMCGRIANRLDLMGPSYAVDAACASSLIALQLGISDLASRRCDMVLAGGIQVSSTFPIALIFSQLGGLSRTGKLSPFHSAADGTLLGEGAGIVVLKRREDAERDGDRIYAVVKGVGTSSDGRALGVLAPRTEGEELAMRRAYELAGVSPQTVQLVEAHGTGTPVGDGTELEALGRIFGEPRDGGPSRALGSVKGMIGHTIPAAGVAGVIKTALSLYHKVLPPTLHDGPHNPKLEATDFYLNTEKRPWVHGGPSPRRAGVSAFGFGGINAHAVLEEHDREASANTHRSFDSEVVIIAASSREELVAKAEQLRSFILHNPDVSLVDLAYTINCPLPSDSSLRLSLIATDISDLDHKLAYALRKLGDPSVERIKVRSGIYFFEKLPWHEAKLAFLFPGEGAQYVNMLADLCIHFPEVRSWFDLMDKAFVDRGRSYLPSETIFPPPGVLESRSEQMLWQMDCGTEVIFTANQALLTLLNRLGIRPQAILGHSTGEYSALYASGVLRFDDNDDLTRSILFLNRVYEQLQAGGRIPEATLLTVGTSDREAVLTTVAQSGGQLSISMDNCPHQTVLCGSKDAVSQAAERLSREGAICTPLPFNRAYHTPQFSHFSDGLEDFFRQLKIFPSQVDLYSCAKAGLYPQNVDEIRRLAVEQWSRPVRFRETIEAMYAAGIRIFVEVGPRGNLTAFVDDILRGRPYLAVPSNIRHVSSITQLNHLTGLLAAHGVEMNLEYLYARRTPQRLSLDIRETAHDNGNDKSRSVRVSTQLPVINLAPDQLKRVPVISTASSFASRVHEHDNGHESDNGTRREHALEQNGRSAAPTVIPALPAQDERAAAMHQYLQTMQRFLEIQQTITKNFLATHHHANGVESQVNTRPSYPFIDRVISLVPGEGLEAICQLDLSNSIFLRDHTLGGAVSLSDPTLTALPVMPLTFSMEILAEAAMTLCPGLLVVALKDVRAFRWIALEAEHLTLKVVAKRKNDAETEIDVKIYEVVDDSHTTSILSDALRVEGTVVLGDSYSTPPIVADFPLRQERASRWLPEHLYDDYMFHGPSLRGVASIERWGEDGTEATLKALPANKLFRGLPDPSFVTDPITLDAAGQLVGYWIAEHQSRGFHVFPTGVREVRFFSPSLRAGELARCRVRSKLIGDWHVESDIDVIGPNERLLVRFSGWSDKRLEVPPQFYRFRISPREAMLARSLNERFPQTREPVPVSCCVLDELSQEYLEANGGIWQSVLAHLILSRREREIWRNLDVAAEERVAWLLGRAVAKEAVRLFLKQHHQLEMCVADVELVQDADGRLSAQGYWTPQLMHAPIISLSYSDGVAVAAAGSGQYQGVGIALGHINQLETDTFEPEALTLLAGENHILRQEWSLRLWCAKEALRKAFGRSLRGLAKDFVVEQADTRTGLIKIRLSEEFARLFSADAGMILNVHTVRTGNLVVATTILKGVNDAADASEALS